MRSMIRLVAVAAATAACVAAQAAPITYAFTGVIDRYYTREIPEIALGSMFSGTLTYDPESPDLGDGHYGTDVVVTGAVIGLDYVGSGRPAGAITVTDAPLDDVLIFDTWQGTSSPDNIGPSIGDLQFYYLRLEMHDTTGTVFSGTSLPASLSLASFDTATFSFNFLENSSQVSAMGTLTSLTPVPEPSTALLAGSGLLALLWRRRQQPS